MMRTASNERGFSLLEVIVMLAVLGALAVMMGPLVFRYIDDANIQRAASDTSAIAAAINKQYRDTGRWPFYEDGDDDLPYTSGTDAALLTSNSASCAATGCTDSTLPTDSTTGSTWALTGLKDSIENHLILNTPLASTSSSKKYAVTGNRAWKGPYLDRIPTTDPWGRSYIVNVANANPSEAAASQKWVLVISAGANGQLETKADQLLATSATPVGDDIIARVR